MKKDGIGGANTLTGLAFEGKTDLETFLTKHSGYSFKKPAYKDVLGYIISVGCSYYFEYIPLNKFNLPVPK
ncbi:MAG: hypothetical protein LBD50_03110 [Rickettsiales bacterium]|jgi:hypothetical protein|nr:hypothetical protein [Rickettsiales bacterium]